MARFEGVKRIVKEEFESKYHSLVDKLAPPINTMMEFVARAMNKGITFDENINCQVKDIDITVDSNGSPTVPTAFKSSLKSPSKGIIVVKATNLTNPATYPTGQPFISFSENNNQITIMNVVGIQAANNYRLKIISLG